jgi:hypothetical protein
VEELLDSSLLVDVVVTVPCQLLHQGVEAESKVVDVLTWLESRVLPLLTQLLKRGLAGAVAADACRGDGILGILGGPLVRERGVHLLRRNSSKKRLQRPPILVEVGVAYRTASHMHRAYIFTFITMDHSA